MPSISYPTHFKIPPAPHTILAGSTLKDILDYEAIDCLAHNFSLVDPQFDPKAFKKTANNGIKPLGIIQRGHFLAAALRKHLPQSYEKAVTLMLRTLTPPFTKTDEMGLRGFFYLPHVCFVSNYGLEYFETSMKAQYELTKRFSAEFSIRTFLINRQKETIAQLKKWTKDPDPHVRRLCSEGSRPRLPWATRIPAFVKDPRPVLPILETLKDDVDLYVRRSVANHLGDIAKDNPDIAFDICEKWLKNASPERKWLIRHAVRHPDRKGNKRASEIRNRARE